MIIYGFAKDYKYAGDGTLKIKVRIPSIHGPYKQVAGKGRYTRDEDLPWVTSVLLPHLPNAGEVVMLASSNSSAGAQYACIGLTGGSYFNGTEI